MLMLRLNPKETHHVVGGSPISVFAFRALGRTISSLWLGSSSREPKSNKNRGHAQPKRGEASMLLGCGSNMGTQSTGVITLTVSGGYQSPKMGLFPFNPPLRG